MEFRSVDTKRDYSVHPSPRIVRHAENMTNERKVRDTSIFFFLRSHL